MESPSSSSRRDDLPPLAAVDLTPLATLQPGDSLVWTYEETPDGPRVVIPSHGLPQPWRSFLALGVAPPTILGLLHILVTSALTLPMLALASALFVIAGFVVAARKWRDRQTQLLASPLLEIQNATKSLLIRGRSESYPLDSILCLVMLSTQDRRGKATEIQLITHSGVANDEATSFDVRQRHLVMHSLGEATFHLVAFLRPFSVKSGIVCVKAQPHPQHGFDQLVVSRL